MAETWRGNRNLLLNCRNEKGAKSRSWFLGCCKQRDSGQGEKSPGGAGILGPLGGGLMWTGECRCACKSQRHETPVVKWGGKHLWRRIQAEEPVCLVAAAISTHVAWYLWEEPDTSSRTSETLQIAAYRSPGTTWSPAAPSLTAPRGGCRGRQRSLQPGQEAKALSAPAHRKLHRERATSVANLKKILSKHQQTEHYMKEL